MKQYFIFDLETEPDMELAEISGYFDNIKPPKNYKDEDKIEKWMETKKEKMVEELALNPKFAKIKMFSICNNSEIYVIPVNNEAKAIEKLGDMIKKAYLQGCEIVTANGCNYDFPVLIERGQINRVPIDYRLLIEMANTPWRKNHYDILKVHKGSVELNSLVKLGKSKEQPDFKTVTIQELSTYSMHEMNIIDSLYKLDCGIINPGNITGNILEAI